MNNSNTNINMYLNQIIEAVFTSDIKELKFLLEKNQTNLNKNNITGMTPLLVACQISKIEIVKLLVEAGANVNLCMSKNEKIKFLDKDGNPLFQSQIGTSPLMLAAMNGDEEVVNYLLSKGADKTLKTASNNTALEFAKWTLDSRKRLLKKKELESKDFSNFENIISVLSIIVK